MSRKIVIFKLIITIFYEERVFVNYLNVDVHHVADQH